MMLTIRSFPAVSLILLLAMAGCDGSGSSGNEPPVIENVLIDPATPAPGQPNISLTAVATDPEDEQLSYAWSAEAGNLDPTTENPTDWDAPDEPGDYEITCTVNDGQATVSKTVTAEVRRDSQ